MTELQVTLEERLEYATTRYDYDVASIELGQAYIYAEVENHDEVKGVLIRLVEQGRIAVRTQKPSIRAYIDTHDDKRKPLKLK